jgi:hypothetical protein
MVSPNHDFGSGEAINPLKIHRSFVKVLGPADISRKEHQIVFVDLVDPMLDQAVVVICPAGAEDLH